MAGRKSDRFVRNADSKHLGIPFAFASALRCALQGIRHTFSTQRNLKIQAVFAVLAVVLGVLLSITGTQWALIVLCIALVFATECMNTAIEALVDLVSPEYHTLAKVAKDCAAGAVLLCSVASLVVAAVVFIPPILELVNA